MPNRVYQELRLPLPVEEPEKKKPKQQRGVAVLNEDGEWEKEESSTPVPGEVTYQL